MRDPRKTPVYRGSHTVPTRIAADGQMGVDWPTVARIMSSPVYTVANDDCLETVANLFVAREISAAPVVDESGELVGVISKTDLLQRYYEGEDGRMLVWPKTLSRPQDLEPGLNELQRDGAVVADVMTPLVIGVPVQALIPQAAAVMAFEGIHHLVIHDARGAMLGLVSSLDVLSWLAHTAGYPVARKRSSTRL